MWGEVHEHLVDDQWALVIGHRPKASIPHPTYSLYFDGLFSSVKEKPKHYEFANVNQVLQKAITVEYCLKEHNEVHRSHVIESNYDISDDENKESNVTKFVLLAHTKIAIYSSLKPIHKNPQDDVNLVMIPLNLIES
jgi:hypothetical protein